MSFPRPRKTYTEDELYEYAVGALGRRMRSVAELKRLLRPRVEAETEYGQTLIELVIRRLKDQGYLNDAQYASAYSAFRRDNAYDPEPLTLGQIVAIVEALTGRRVPRLPVPVGVTRAALSLAARSPVSRIREAALGAGIALRDVACEGPNAVTRLAATSVAPREAIRREVEWLRDAGR